MSRKTLNDIIDNQDKQQTKSVGRPKSKVLRQPVSIHMNKELHKKLKILAAEIDVTVADLVEEGITNVLIKNKKM